MSPNGDDKHCLQFKLKSWWQN